MLVFTGGFYFTGRVQTINGENYIRNSRAITVKEDLSEFMEIEDEPGEDAVSLYGSLFENGGQFDYETCNNWCQTYWSIGRPDNEIYEADQCVQVVSTDDENGIPGQYLCSTEIIFRQRTPSVPI